MKAKPLQTVLILCAMVLLPGCMNYQSAMEQIQRCPEYMQENIGKVKCEVSWKAPFVQGFVRPGEPGNPIHLLPLADNDVVLEEAFHSFELKAGNERYEEWERFYLDFHSDGSTYENYGGLVTSALIMSVPMLDYIPWPGYVNFHATVSHFEDTAECFVHIMHDRPAKNPRLAEKCEAVRKFVDGGYRVEGSEQAENMELSADTNTKGYSTDTL